MDKNVIYYEENTLLNYNNDEIKRLNLKNNPLKKCLCSPNRVCSCKTETQVDNIELSDSDYVLQMKQDDYKTQEQGEENDNDEDDLNELSEAFFKRIDSFEIDLKPKKAKIVKNFLIGDVLGDGSYGKVKECLDLDTLSRRAVKIINFKRVSRKIPHGITNVRKEINIMQRLNHKNVIKLYDTHEKNLDEETNDKPPKLYIFMDYCMTNLERLLKNAPDQRLHNWQANHYFKQLIDGLDYLHSLNIIHNDIKPGNLLITCDDVLKICDYSISAELSVFHEHEFKQLRIQESFKSSQETLKPNLLTNMNNRNRFPILQCTPMFQCPEMLDDNIEELFILKHANKIDIWSSGITLYQLTTGKLPFTGETIHQIFETIRSSASHHLNLPDFIDKNLKELIFNMLNRDPLKRWSIKQIRDSEWFKKKHPIVKEELVMLPQDVIQNELNSFRMISYLEKICQVDCTKSNTLLDTTNSYNTTLRTNNTNGQLVDYLQNGHFGKHKTFFK